MAKTDTMCGEEFLREHLRREVMKSNDAVLKRNYGTWDQKEIEDPTRTFESLLKLVDDWLARTAKEVNDVRVDKKLDQPLKPGAPAGKAKAKAKASPGGGGDADDAAPAEKKPKRRRKPHGESGAESEAAPAKGKGKGKGGKGGGRGAAADNKVNTKADSQKPTPYSGQCDECCWFINHSPFICKHFKGKEAGGTCPKVHHRLPKDEAAKMKDPRKPRDESKGAAAKAKAKPKAKAGAGRSQSKMTDDEKAAAQKARANTPCPKHGKASDKTSYCRQFIAGKCDQSEEQCWKANGRVHLSAEEVEARNKRLAAAKPKA